MNRKVLTITLAVLLTLLLSVGGVTGQEPEGEVRPQGEVSIAATVGSRISYQGILKEGGTPVNESRDMTFRLYSDSSCTTQVGSDIARPGVTVIQGLFSLKLDVNQHHFNGQGLWLGVDVGNTGANVVCEEILPAPYALSLRPGAEVIGAQTGWDASTPRTQPRQALLMASTGGATPPPAAACMALAITVCMARPQVAAVAACMAGPAVAG